MIGLRRSSSTPTCSSTRSTSARCPTWGDFALGIAVGMVAYTGIETISNMSEEARDAIADDPARDRAGGARGGRPLRAAAGDRALGDAGRRRTRTASSRPSSATTFADDPVLGIVENLGLSAGLTDVLRVYVGILAAVILLIATNAGADRALAADLLDGPAPPAARDPARDPSAVQDALRRDHRLLGRRGRWSWRPGETDVPGDDLRVRRDALVHGRPRLGDPAAQDCGRSSERPRRQRRRAAVALAGQRPDARGARCR